MRIDFIGDTNFIIYLLEGNEAVDSFLSYRFGVSFVTEVELLGFRDLDSASGTNIQALISDVLVLGWYPELRDMTIFLRKKTHHKTTLRHCRHYLYDLRSAVGHGGQRLFQD